MQSRIQKHNFSPQPLEQFKHTVCSPAGQFQVEEYLPYDEVKVYVGNIPKKMSQSMLQVAFEQFGAVKKCYVCKGFKKGENFGFVIFFDRASAQNALSAKVVKALGRLLQINPTIEKKGFELYKTKGKRAKRQRKKGKAKKFKAATLYHNAHCSTNNHPKMAEGSQAIKATKPQHQHVVTNSIADQYLSLLLQDSTKIRNQGGQLPQELCYLKYWKRDSELRLSERIIFMVELNHTEGNIRMETVKSKKLSMHSGVGTFPSFQYPKVNQPRHTAAQNKYHCSQPCF